MGNDLITSHYRPLSLDTLKARFTTTKFPVGIEEKYQGQCGVFDTGEIGKGEAKALLLQFIGFEKLLTQHFSASDDSAREQARQKYIQRYVAKQEVTTPIERRHITLAGDPGVGKSSLAAALGVYYTATGQAPEPKVVFTSSSSLIGGYLGHTEGRVQSIFDIARGGVLVIDEIGDWLTNHYGSTAANTLNSRMEDEIPHKTIVIVTGYEEGIKAFLRMNDGLSRRFPERMVLPVGDETILERILAQKVASFHCQMDDAAHEEAVRQLLKAKSDMGTRFGNAGTAENLAAAMFKQHDRTTDIEIVRKLNNGMALSEAERQAYTTITRDSVPDYDPKSKNFVVVKRPPLKTANHAPLRPATVVVPLHGRAEPS